MAQILQDTGNAPDRIEILRRASRLKAILRERAARCEALRRVPDETIADLIESRILRTCQPARFGGSQLGFDTLCEMSLETAQGDGAQAWVAEVYGEHAYLVSLFGDEAQHDVWDGNPDMLISASVVPLGNHVEREKGGYRLSGRWPFVSGVHHAGWIFIAELAATEASKEMHYFLVPRSEIKIEDDWHTIGMVGTGSNSIILDNSFVPPHRVILSRDVVAGTAPGARVNQSPLYRMPLMGFGQVALSSVTIGVALGMVEDFKAQLRTKPGTDLLYGTLAEASAETRAASLLLLDASGSNVRKLMRGETLGEGDAVATMRNTAYAVTLAKRAANRLFEATGGRGIYLSAPMQRSFRDVMSSAAHGSFNWERSALRYAKHAVKA